MKSKDQIKKIQEEIKARQKKAEERMYRTLDFKELSKQKLLIPCSIEELCKITNKLNDIDIERDILHSQVLLFEKIEFRQLPNNLHLSNNQLIKLYHKMIKQGYISNKTEEDIFIWFLGGNDKPNSLIDWELTDQKLYVNGEEVDDSLLQSYLEQKLTDNRIIWTKYTSTTHKYHFNKQALLDFMELLKVPENLWHQKGYCSNFFINEKKEEIIFNRENYKVFKASKHQSEYHDELQEIISSVLK